jgi:gamma-glutamylcysteine synthetase
LENEFAKESAIAQQSEGASYTFATYKKAIAERRVTLLESIDQVDTEILDLTNEMKELFQDLKRFELTHAERQQQKAYKKERTEDGLRDEQALVRYRRGEGNA